MIYSRTQNEDSPKFSKKQQKFITFVKKSANFKRENRLAYVEVRETIVWLAFWYLSDIGFWESHGWCTR